jgi:hypothetical protein
MVEGEGESLKCTKIYLRPTVYGQDCSLICARLHYRMCEQYVVLEV